MLYPIANLLSLDAFVTAAIELLLGIAGSHCNALGIAGAYFRSIAHLVALVTVVGTVADAVARHQPRDASISITALEHVGAGAEFQVCG